MDALGTVRHVVSWMIKLKSQERGVIYAVTRADRLASFPPCASSGRRGRRHMRMPSGLMLSKEQRLT